MTKSEFIEIAGNAGFNWACQELRSEDDGVDLESAESLVEYAQYCLNNWNYNDALEVVEALANAPFGCEWFRYDFCGKAYAVETLEDVEDLLEDFEYEEDDDDEE